MKMKNDGKHTYSSLVGNSFDLVAETRRTIPVEIVHDEHRDVLEVH